MSSFFARFKRRSWLGYLLLGLLAGGVAVFLGLAVIGFPDFLTRWILSGVNSGDFYIQVHNVNLDLGGGVKARNVSVYRKGIPGPPFLEARECRVLFHLLDLPRAGRSRVKELRVYDGVLRPLWNATGAGEGAASDEPRKTSAPREVDLDVALFNFDVLGVWVEQVKAAVQVDSGGVYCSRLSGKVGREMHSGLIDGTLALRREGKLTGRLATSFDPRALIPVCKMFYPEAVGMLDRFSFPTTPPRMDFTFEAGLRPALSVTVKGRAQASNYAYRGAVIGYASMSGEYVFGGGTNRMNLDPFSLTMDGRQARGQVDFDFIAGVADFQVRSEIDLASVLRLVGLREYLMSPWHFEEGTRLVAKGRVGYSHPEVSRIEAMVEGEKISYKGISCNNYSFDYKNQGYVHALSDFRGHIGGGSLSGAAVLMADPSGTNWTVDLKTEVINADTDELLKLVSTNLGWRMGGKIFGSLEIDGLGAVPVGQGQFTIRNTRVFKSPLGAGLLTGLGGISRELDLSNIPAEAHFTFELKHNRISSQDVSVELGGVGILAQGSCGLNGTLDWILKPVFMKNNRATGKMDVSALFLLKPDGYVLTGSLEKPEWRPAPTIRKTDR